MADYGAGKDAQSLVPAQGSPACTRPRPRQTPFDLTWARRLHREMFGQVWTWAGQFRTYNTNLGIDWQQIEAALQSLLEDLTTWDDYGVSPWSKPRASGKG
jgi:fido (protein-threonine AMPylation protein)